VHGAELHQRTACGVARVVETVRVATESLAETKKLALKTDVATRLPIGLPLTLRRQRGTKRSMLRQSRSESCTAASFNLSSLQRKIASTTSSFSSGEDGGVRLFGVSGHVNKPGIFEACVGLTLRELIYDLGGGVKGGELLAVIPGGSSCPILRADEIVHAKDVAHLFPIAVHRYWCSTQGGVKEVCHPALVFVAELARASNARHAKYYGLQSVNSGVIPHVLISGSFGTSIWGVKIHRLLFRSSARFSAAVAFSVEIKIVPAKISVNFVGRSENQRWRIAYRFQSFKQIQCTTGIHFEVFKRRLKTCRHCDLRREVKNNRHAR